MLEKADFILGRTTWDRAHSYAINPEAKYYSCNRVLRRPFYEKNWDIDDIEKAILHYDNIIKGMKNYKLNNNKKFCKEFRKIVEEMFN